MAEKKSALREYLDANKRGSRLTGPIERHLLTREPEDRRTDVFHPSEVVRSDWCHRASYLAVVEGRRPKPERHNLRTNSIFAEGHFIHEKWQGWLEEMGVLYGLWECSECGATEWHFSYEAAKDHECGRWQYREVPLREDSLRIRGHADGWVVGLGDDFLIEIKSIGAGSLRMEAFDLLDKHSGDAEAAFNDIRNPFRTHFLQGQMYLALVHRMHEAGLIDRTAPDEMVFLYELKSNQSAKEFVTRYSPEYVEPILSDIGLILAMSEAPECNLDPAKGCKKCRAFEEDS